jgi:hypothetical protein
METNIALLELLEEETFTNFWTDVEIVGFKKPPLYIIGWILPHK